MKKSILFILLSFGFLFAQGWQSVAPLPRGVADARHHPVTFSVGNYGYVLTGGLSNSVADDFMRYDATTDTWEILPDFPGGARSYAYGTARGTKAYVGFGGTGSVLFNDLWEYDTQTEVWTQLADCPCSGRYHPAFIQLNDKIFVGLGNDPANKRDWWEYDIPTNSWSQKTSLPGPARHHPFYFGIDSIVYVGFGHGNSFGGNTNILKDFYRYDPQTQFWTRLADFPGEARVAGTQFDYNGKGYILSGDGDNHSFMPEGKLWEYDPSTDSWLQLPSHPGSSRWAPGSFVIDDYAYLVGGLSNVRLENDMMRYSLLTPITSAGDVSDSRPLSVFPNPATNFFIIEGDIASYSEIRLLNNYGQVVRDITSNRVEVAELPGGVYFLQLIGDEAVHNHKIMIVD